MTTNKDTFRSELRKYMGDDYVNFSTLYYLGEFDSALGQLSDYVEIAIDALGILADNSDSLDFHNETKHCMDVLGVLLKNIWKLQEEEESGDESEDE